jgi:cyclopropane fatty-acyl-phospholipid synthase-like methyltransferase
MIPGYIPQLSNVVEHIEGSELEIVQVFGHDRSNYFRTLLAWTDNFYQNGGKPKTVLNRLVTPQETQTIMRLWEFYLCGSRLAFNEANGDCYNVQLLLRKLKGGGSASQKGLGCNHADPARWLRP